MTHYPSTSVFASVRLLFDTPRFREEALITIATAPDAVTPSRLTAVEAHQALYGPEADPQLGAAVWEAVLTTAQADRTPHGDGTLLAIWLALPRLTGTATRVCKRLRADRVDVEAEMVLALIEQLRTLDSTDPLAVAALLKAARNRAWDFARAGLREIPSTQVERITQDRSVTAPERMADAPTTRQGLDVRVDRPDGPDGLRASLRFRVRPEHLRDAVLARPAQGAGAGEPDRCHRSRRSRRRVGTLPIRPTARRA
ncbi:hypothetical protein AB0A05_17950 [Streptomyces sp. NPDC046374]|uniref:hypothetical protein n=1 Tax=Streptomyces sp. NPDC046374 TaxID=3154917 RepID=UPI0033F5C0A8